jgi:hypothetical protein
MRRGTLEGLPVSFVRFDKQPAILVQSQRIRTRSGSSRIDAGGAPDGAFEACEVQNAGDNQESGSGPGVRVH